jgi:predicted HTH domain antitoxin
MSPDAAVLTTTSAVAAAVVLYLAWRQRHDQEQWRRKIDQQDLLREIQRELLQQQNIILARYAELRRRLDHQHRILKYVSRRLS